jgi:hypothetical protein
VKDYYAALAAFQDAMPTVPKNRTATGSDGRSYTYADLADVVAAAQPILGEHGLVFNARPGIGPDGAPHVIGRLVHIASGDGDEGRLPLHGRHPQDIGSALTYARRYLLACLTGLITEDDDDGAAAVGRGVPTTTATASPADREAALYAALDAAADLPALAGLYDEYQLGMAPEPVRQRYSDRVAAVRAAWGEQEADA